MRNTSINRVHSKTARVDQARTRGSRSATISRQLRVVHATLRPHSERRAGASGRVADGRVPAHGSRRHAQRPPHRRDRAGLRATLRALCVRGRRRRCGRDGPTMDAGAALAPRMGRRPTHPRKPGVRLLERSLGSQTRALQRWRRLHVGSPHGRPRGEPHPQDSHCRAAGNHQFLDDRYCVRARCRAGRRTDRSRSQRCDRRCGHRQRPAGRRPERQDRTAPGAGRGATVGAGRREDGPGQGDPVVEGGASVRR